MDLYELGFLLFCAGVFLAGLSQIVKSFVTTKTETSIADGISHTTTITKSGLSY